MGEAHDDVSANGGFISSGCVSVEYLTHLL